jgi:hypothetical protein
MAYSAFAAPPRDDRRGLITLFDHLMRAVTSPCPDPGRAGPPVDEHLTDAQRARACGLLVEARSRLEVALRSGICGPGRGLS